MAEIIENLGLGVLEICFHTMNLLILIIVLRLLLFKPVMKMIENHKAKLNDIFEQNQKLNAEATEMKHKYDQLLVEMKEEVIKVSAEANEKAQAKSSEMIDGAKKQASAIVETAKKEVMAEKARLKNDFTSTVSSLAIEIAGKVLEREVNVSDNKKIIENCLNEWEK